MTRVSRLLLCAWVAVLAVESPGAAALPRATSQTNIASPNVACPTGSVFEADTIVSILNLCDFTGKILTDHGVGALVPDPGNGVYAEGHEKGADLGVGQEFAIEVATNGTITLRFLGDDSLSLGGIVPRASAVPSACSDTAKTLEGFKEKSTLHWRLNKGTIPGDKAHRDAVAEAIKRGAGNVHSIANNCGIGGSDIAIHLNYDGLSGKRANMDSNGNCGQVNDLNVADFGSLPVSARTCSWYAIQDGRDKLVASDVRFDKGESFTMSPGDPGCSNKLDIEGVATHEFGHAFGLAHVSTEHQNLTMTARLPVCSSGPRTLGLGDIRGLRALY